MAEERVSAILEQVRAIKADKSSSHFLDSWQYIETLVLRLQTIRSKIDASKFRPFLIQLLMHEIDGCALDEVLYDIEDLFSDSNTRLMKGSLQTEASRNPKSTISIPESATTARLNTDPFDWDSMNLDTDPFESSISKLEVELMDLRSKLSPEPESFLVEVSKLHGIHEVKKDIMDVILGENSEQRSENIKTISIVGMEGMGKTSLAQCICEDEQVVASFDNIILVNASYDFDLPKIAKAIIQALEGLKHDFLCILTLVPLQSLLDRIYRKIVKKKSLLV
ncbi:uncharacterized protein LOC120208155 [Hibiscus syriacus]|uniref:uncharacterized protein LOC120208155 n=1 Tax=Hibiscus syriacus TaxID=106335 RepID=UPI0019246444|nr:uncharacterized protein LOC120208155 [Hibiscus syriacus]XP_039063431.1 uncharacterized protein LOC120208155 [Hibiscus syriacus]